MSNPNKILYVHHGSGKAGASTSLLFALQGLDQKRFLPVVACGYNESMAKSFFESHGFPPVDVPVARFSHTAGWWSLFKPYGFAKTMEWLLVKHPRSKRALRSILKRSKPDIVHLNSLTLAPLMPMIKRHGIPVVLHVREPVASGTLGLRRMWLRYLARNYASHVIYICKDNRDRLTGPMPHATVMYNPIPFDKFDKSLVGNACREKLGIAENVQVLFFPGGSSFGIKGIFPFLEALSIVHTQKQDVVALVSGIDTTPHPRNKERPRIEDAIKALNLECTIHRLPFTYDVEEYYAASDIIIAPFIKPHFSRAVIEAGAMMKPVLGSRIGGIEEVLTDGENGFLVEPGNAKDLAEKILLLCRNKPLAEQLANKGYIQAKTLCDAKEYVTRLMTLYTHLMA